MPLFELKSITELTIENAKEDYRASKRAEQSPANSYRKM